MLSTIEEDRVYIEFEAGEKYFTVDEEQGRYSMNETKRGHGSSINAGLDSSVGAALFIRQVSALFFLLGCSVLIFLLSTALSIG